MKSLETLTEELLDDACETCNQDSGYLRSLLRCYFESLPEDARRKMHADAFGHEDDAEDEEEDDENQDE